MSRLLYARTHASSVAKARACWAAGKHLEAGRLLFESVPPSDQPRWAAQLLQRACAEVPPPDCVAEVLRVALDADRWREGHKAFDAVRNVLLAEERRRLGKDPLLLHVLHLAEGVAKVTYNASGPPDEFDHDSGWYLPEFLLRLLQVTRVPAPEREVEELIFGAAGA